MDIDDLLKMSKLETNSRLMTEIALVNQLVESQNWSSIVQGKFVDGRLNKEQLVWDKFYKRILIDDLITQKFGRQQVSYRTVNNQPDLVDSYSEIISIASVTLCVCAIAYVTRQSNKAKID